MAVWECPRPEYPRPDFVRSEWLNLNGEWEFAFDDENRGLRDRWYDDAAAPFPLRICVPFAFQTPLSGIGDRSFHDVMWYRRRIVIPRNPAWQGKRILLHFGAVDYAATVWVNGQLVADHEGGHTPFTADITSALIAPQNLFDTPVATIVVRAWDPSTNLEIPRGKQHWKVDSEGIFYTRTSGIWQTVWLEPVSPAAYLQRVQLTTEPGGRKVRVQAWIAGGPDLTGTNAPLRLDITTRYADRTVATAQVVAGVAPTGGTAASVAANAGAAADAASSAAGDANSSAAGDADSAQIGMTTAFLGTAPVVRLETELLPNEVHLWSPETPNLYSVNYRLYLGDHIIDTVDSYLGLRWVSIEGGRVCLNGQPYYMKLVLDQGYWPDGLLTAPTDAALRADIEWGKAFGFNGCRKHQKVEDPRFLYWADRLGYLVWGEMANAYRYSEDAARRLLKEWLQVVARDYNHPCVVAWVPINESWGVSELAHDRRQVDHQLSLYHTLKSLDPTRFVMSNDGWEHARSDLLTVHDYSGPQELSNRYHSLDEALRFRPANRSLFAPGVSYAGEPLLVTEYGGLGFRKGEQEQGWGYGKLATNEEELVQRYRATTEALLASPLVQGICYTQLTDVEQEINGLLTYDRRPKVDPVLIKAINTKT
ncbi:MAG: glycoside hydrolase family 2 [Limnochordaceae bacterium]|nr:glycoside hydrolase family 2 [Limnochordaceae bacterium]